MPESTDTSTNTATILDTWIKSVNDIWSNTITPFQMPDSADKNEKEQTTDTDFWQTGMETWQTIVSAMSHSAPSFSSMPGMGTFPETFLQMTQPVFSSITQMLAQWQGQSLKSADNIKLFDFDTIASDSLNVWKKLYDTEFRKFFKAPQLGLAREHQEKVMRFLDRFNILQTTMAEFLNFLAIPFKKTNSDFQDKLTQLTQKNELPKEAKDYYRIWLKILEGHYMTLFQSPDYIHCLGKTLTASAAYTRAKKELVNDLLQQLSIPSSEHMDAVYKELHGLKKRLKALEKAVTNR